MYRHRSLWFAVILFPMFAQNAPAKQPSVKILRDESWMTYTLTHPLHTFDATSRDVQYVVSLDSANRAITGVSGTVDVTTFDSRNSNRDSHAMEVIDAITYPDASFQSTRIIRDGDSLAVAGKMTFHGVTRDVISNGSAVWSADTLTVSERFSISMTSFGIERPSLLLMPVGDTLHFTLHAVFQLH